MTEHPSVAGLVAELGGWPGRALKSHKSASHLLHKLSFVADLGVRYGDPGVKEVVERILERQSTEGPFRVAVSISPSYGGSGQEQLAWALCDTPLILYALGRFGLGDDERVAAAASYLAGLAGAGGWGCVTSRELGGFRGPGRKGDPCPYATLTMLKALAQFPQWRDSPAAHSGTETLLRLWSERGTRHPYMFFMGTDFCKLKAPLVWYDILHVLDVMTRFPWVREDGRLREMADTVMARADARGRFAPESVWQAWSEWDFGQKKEPSRGLTVLAARIHSRVDG